MNFGGKDQIRKLITLIEIAFPKLELALVFGAVCRSSYEKKVKALIVKIRISYLRKFNAAIKSLGEFAATAPAKNSPEGSVWVKDGFFSNTIRSFT